MIPGWKLKREAERLKVQAQSLPMRIYEPFLQRRHDKNREHTIAISEGTIPSNPRMAIFLIFQPKGVAPSVFRSAAHLVTHGYAPIIVSNGPLSQTDRYALQQHAHIVAERPNLGYDFGGYRDGLWILKTRQLTPQALLFVNDSVWFPVWPNDNSFAQLCEIQADYVGTQVFGDTRPEAKRRGIFGSYCFLIQGPLLHDHRFVNFWTNYRLSSNKEVTLRRGERAFSHLMFDTAARYHGLFSQERFAHLLAGIDRPRLFEALEETVVTAPPLVAQKSALLACGDAASSDAIREFIQLSARSKNYIAAAPILSLRELGFPMIKKNNERHYALARAQIVRAMDLGKLDGIDPVIAQELRAKVALS